MSSPNPYPYTGPLTSARLNTPLSSPLKRGRPSHSDASSSPLDLSSTYNKSSFKPAKKSRVTFTPPSSSRRRDGRTFTGAGKGSDATTRPDTPVPCFKLPPAPFPARARLMTPTTSTVAASSSPRRLDSELDIDHLNDYPNARNSTKAGAEPIETVVPSREEIIVFGRHRNALAAGGETISLPPTTATLDRNLPTRSFNLPRTASHVSRIHAALVLLPYSADQACPGSTYRIVVFGQNGIKLRVDGESKSRRVKTGQSVDLSADSEMCFFGYSLRIEVPVPPVVVRRVTSVEEEDEEEEEEGFKGTMFSSDALDAEVDTDDLSPPPSLPPSSPPMMAPSSPAQSVTLELKEEMILGVPLQSGSASPPLATTETTIAAPTPASIETSSAPTTTTLEPPLQSSPPEHIDLPALLANTVVFSGSSKLSLPDLVKHMLETQPSLKELGSEAQWSLWAGNVLENEPMFGKVHRNGKDASGHPLLPHYFYSPETDTDASRAKELGGLVRPLRAAQRAGGKALDWRPVGGGRRR